MNVIYPVIFTETNDKKSTILIEIPDIKGFTEGYGIADAINMAKDFIGNSLFDKLNSEIPAPSRIDSIDLKKSEFAKAGKSFVSLVDVDLDMFRQIEKSRNVRRNITLPQWLDDMSRKAKINVSAVTQNALKKTLGF